MKKTPTELDPIAGRDAALALQKRLQLGREQYSPKMFAKISGGLWPQIEAVLAEREALEQKVVALENRTCWFVESFHKGKSEGWFAAPPGGSGGWLTTDPHLARRYSKSEAEVVAQALSYFHAPFRWSCWVATEHVFLEIPS